MPIKSLQPMSFVTISGFGANPVVVKVSLDSKQLILSTYYLLSGPLAIEELIKAEIGDQASLISKHRQNYVDLTKLIQEKEKTNPEGRIKSNDVLLLIRALHFLEQAGKSSSESLTLSELENAIQEAIRVDDYIKDIHYQITSVLAELPKA
jgi:hypothetical protein